ncbi:MAG TPA: hypothetical protein VD971_00505 [Phycisphaerales bacterium]|nr:hypothetical protein [Phycisphaerales bacterium]
MDAIDIAIANAWNRLSPQLQRDRAEALRRAQRLSATTLRRPVRAWCCCLRASDTRFTDVGEIDPPDALRWRDEHTLRVPAAALRKLCAPVHIPWPGLRWRDAAAKLGFHPETLRAWVERGVFGKRTQFPATVGSRGKPVPFLWRREPIDPAGELGRGPHAAWGSLWLTLHEDIPDGADLHVRRVADWRVHGRERRFNGWRFVCPGVVRPCGRPTDRLYLPIRVWTIHHATVGALARGEAGADTRWACGDCHGVVFHSCSTVRGWNLLISHLTSGLLYGHEVERPYALDDIPVKRRRKRPRPSPRAAMALGMRERGLSYKEIGRAMGIAAGTASHNAYRARRRRKAGEGGEEHDPCEDAKDRGTGEEKSTT